MTRTAKMQGLESPSPALQGDDIIADPVLSRTFSGPAMKKKLSLVAALVVVQRRRLQGVKGAAQRQPQRLALDALEVPLLSWSGRHNGGGPCPALRPPWPPAGAKGRGGLRGEGDGYQGSRGSPAGRDGHQATRAGARGAQRPAGAANEPGAHSDPRRAKGPPRPRRGSRRARSPRRGSRLGGPGGDTRKNAGGARDKATRNRRARGAGRGRPRRAAGPARGRGGAQRRTSPERQSRGAGGWPGLLQNSFLQQPYCFTLSILFRGQGCRLQPKFLF